LFGNFGPVNVSSPGFCFSKRESATGWVEAKLSCALVVPRCFSYWLYINCVRVNRGGRLMGFAGRRLFKIAAAAALFAGGVAAGNWHAQSVAAQNRFGQPKSVVHVVVYKWKNTTSQNDKDQALAGIKTMAAKIPGVKNIWLKTQRNQIRDFDGVYAVEFTSAEAAADYAESPLHEAWRKRWEELRENSLSFQVSNP
jgi:Stress responsive A/B Barrel Domain